MAKLLIVQVPAADGIPAHTVQMRPEEAARFWEAQEAKFRANQERVAARQETRRDIPDGSGAVLTRDDPAMAGALRSMGVPVQEGAHEFPPFDRTLQWDPEARLRLDLVPAGLRFLDRWQVACPLWSYTELARDIGEEAEREETVRVIRDLRVPVYDTRVLFIRRCQDAESLMETWRREQEETRGDLRLSSLRSLYRVKPLVLALPTTWINRQ